MGRNRTSNRDFSRCPKPERTVFKVARAISDSNQLGTNPVNFSARARLIESLVKEYVSLMLELVGYFNSQSGMSIQLNQDVWRDDVAPKWGSARVHDS